LEKQLLYVSAPVVHHNKDRNNMKEAAKTKRMEPMKGVPEAHNYFAKNGTFVQLADLKGHLADHLYCIDGRSTESGGISFPGGGAGVVALIFAAINVAFIRPWEDAKDSRAKGARKSFAFGRVIKIIERILGGMSCHTDDKAADEPLACAGCGHAMAFLNGGYGVGEMYRTGLVKYFTELKRRALRKEPHIKVACYPGVHQESAVLRLLSLPDLGEFLSVPSTDGEMSVFVFNETMNIWILSTVTGLLYEELRPEFKKLGISKEEYRAHVESLYFQHTRSSAFKLAHGKKVLEVRHVAKGQVIIGTSNLTY
jgi:hypothetical protein